MNKWLSKLICPVFCLFLLAGKAYSQNSNSKFSLGGDFSLQFGTITLINISPKLAYQASEKFAFGPGLIYQYYRDNRFEVSSNVYGASAFARYRIFDNVAAYSEYQQLFYNVNIEGEGISRSVPILFVGGQFITSVGANFSVSASILYDVLENEFSPYQNPYIGIGGAYNF